MKFPYPMLRDFVETSLSAEEVGDLLTMAGFELEDMQQVEGDSVFDVKVMSNRGDGLSVFGLAREVLAKNAGARPTGLYREIYDLRFTIYEGGQAGQHSPSDIQHSISERASVDIQTEDCPRYACRLFEGVQNGGSPEWIQKRLRQSGMRPISLLVDLTNYVLLELGQPLHAFDCELLKGGKIIVRKARTSEKLTTLDGIEHEL